jgi:nitrite reductase/ring-hydroxylating ferredoxin subunit
MRSIDDTPVDATSAHVCPCVAGGDPRTIARREFVVGAAAALAAMALAACSTTTGDFLTSPGTVAVTSIKVSDFPALASVGGVATTTVSGIPLAIVRTGASSFAAFSRICPHQGTTIDVFTNGFQCPRHGATFNASGQWIGGQRTSNLTSYPVGYDAASGTLTIGG